MSQDFFHGKRNVTASVCDVLPSNMCATPVVAVLFGDENDFVVLALAFLVPWHRECSRIFQSARCD